MKKSFAPVTMTIFWATLARADIHDGFLFAASGIPGGGNLDLVTLIVEDALGNSYSFTTSYDEINPGVYNQGWWSPSIASFNSNSNFLVEVGGINTNDYFTFNMGQNTLAAPIVSAILSIQTDTTVCSPSPSCQTEDLPQTYYVGSVSVDAATLKDKAAGYGGNGLAIYDDLR
jgi:hypothetical protein